ncbi:MAG TPA: DUF4388 domain-containing protein [Anaeromyxobacteraceae bacterium]|nr:DUF4388 domain-containing protein [Anaeromyxobacteraceae bacterium]
MALTGTLKDFGIAEILQLIGQQAKSGALHLKNRNDEIHILVSSGFVVSAEFAGRKSREKLGSLLVRAGLITQAQLQLALDAQKRTLRRLGDILIELGMVAKEELKEMTALQTTETVYQLFHWKSGTYDFEPGEVEYDRETVTPLRCESMLMEGFRQVDEWPMIRRKIPSTAVTFERVKELDLDSSKAAWSSPARAPEEEPGEGDASALGRNEWRVYELAVAGRTVEKIADLSRLGEFEACKALFNLVNLDVLRAVAPSRRSAAAEVGAYARDWEHRLREGASRLLATAAIALALAALGFFVTERGLAVDPTGVYGFHDNRAEMFLARWQLERIRSALEIYRLERGHYPDALGALVEEGLLGQRDLRYPWTRGYWYRRDGEGYRLLPPVE